MRMSRAGTSRPQGRNRAFVWIVMLLLAIPALHILSVPVVVYGVVRCKASKGVYTLSPWTRTYEAPYQWLLTYTPLRSPLLTYDKWWKQRLVTDQMLNTGG